MTSVSPQPVPTRDAPPVTGGHPARPPSTPGFAAHPGLPVPAPQWVKPVVSTRAQRARPLFAGSMVAIGTLYTGVMDPNTSHAFPLCPLKLFTGLDCPACGCLRSVHSLTQADVVGAASHNLLFVLAVPFAVVGWFLWLGRSRGWFPASRRPMLPTWAMYAGLAVVAVFTITRNLPVDGLHWLNSAA